MGLSLADQDIVLPATEGDPPASAQAQEQEDAGEAPKSDAEIVEELKKGSYLTPTPTEDQVKAIRHQWGLEGLSKYEIARLNRVGTDIANIVTRGIPRGTPPEGKVPVQELVKEAIAQSAPAQAAVQIAETQGRGHKIEVPTLRPVLPAPAPVVAVPVVAVEKQPSARKQTEPPPPPAVHYISPAISPENIGRLYTLAIARNVPDLDSFVMELIEWYGVRIDWEMKSGKSGMTIMEFREYLEDVTDAALKYMKLAQDGMRMMREKEVVIGR